MKNGFKKSLDLFKQRTLRRLSDKDEVQRIYPITKADLVYTKKCASCDSSNATIIAEVHLKKLNFFTTVVCNDCTFVFRSVSPSFKWFLKNWKKIKSDKLEVFNPEVEAIRKIRYEKYYKLLSKYADRGKVLDIGAGYGTGSRVFKNHGYSVKSIEPEDNKAQYIERVLKIPVHKNNIDSFLSTKERYDFIILAHCLEHIDNPSNVLVRLKKLLNPSGILYVEVPILWNYITWSDALYLTHKSNFDEEHIEYFVQNCGFTILKRVRIRHSPREAFDLGLILEVNNENTSFTTSKSINKEFELDKVFKLYRKKLPLTNIPRINTKLIYSVPHIDQFYCTLRFENYKLGQSPNNPNVLIFSPKSL